MGNLHSVHTQNQRRYMSIDSSSFVFKNAKCIQSYFLDDPKKHDYIRQKYAKFVIPLEEAEW